MSGRRRLKVNEARLAEGFRVVAYRLGDQVLSSFRRLSGNATLDPASLLILITISNASIQRAIRESGADAIDHSTAEIDLSHFRPISRRAIAEATGLSRETVRRKVNRLIASGHVLKDGRGVKRANVIANPQTVLALRDVLDGNLALMNRLLADGVIELDEPG